MNRRDFMKRSAAGLAIAASAGGRAFAAASSRRKVIVLGIDGMDPQLLQRYANAGLMPRFKQLMDRGGFRPLQTSTPPQSPVAWSTFTTGMDPSGHGIFDFLHRKPETREPYLSISEAVPAAHSVRLGSWELPMGSGSVNLLRRGRAFWQILEEHGIPTTVFRMPANFPPAESAGYSLSDMGTPDILGTAGTFQYFTDAPPRNAKDITGGIVHRVRVESGVVKAAITGPTNDLKWETGTSEYGAPKSEHPTTEAPLVVYVDRENKTAKLVVDGAELILKQGEWSDWLRVYFRMITGLVGVNAVCRVYLKEVYPNFKLYMTPLQIDPENPAMPISTPANWSAKLARDLGPFYTQGLPEDTKAYSGAIFSGMEFWDQAQLVLQERLTALDYFLNRFDDGLLFFYIGSIDQNSHMLWHFFDERHPFHDPNGELKDGLQKLYVRMDEALGRVLEVVDDDTTLLIMSDHGFNPFYRGVNLNTWLINNGYMKLKGDAAPEQTGDPFHNVDWSRTTAYALGLNSLYLNVKGREYDGAIEDGNEYQNTLDRLARDLTAMVDPKTGSNAVSLVTLTRREFKHQVDYAPDVIVGYNRGYRITSKSALGEFPAEVFEDNMDPWSADHCIDHRVVPGVFLTNRKITMDAPALQDVTAAVLSAYGIEPLPEMIGGNCIDV